jgi:hypothetical protein
MIKDFIKDLTDIRMALDLLDSDLDELSAEVDLLESADGGHVDTQDADMLIQTMSDALSDLIDQISDAINEYSEGHQELSFDSEERKE